MMKKGFLEKQISKLEKFKGEGYTEVCIACRIVYKQVPTQHYEDGHGGRDLEMCSCGSDLFNSIDKTISGLSEKLKNYKG
jgi:hypothetical protein